MWNYIRRKLGLQNIEGFNSCQAQILYSIRRLEQDMVMLRSDLTSTYFTELDPRRKDASDRLAQKMLEKMSDDDKARKHTAGEM